MKTFSKKDPVVISCYGDSNTRYFYGDTQEDAPAQESYPAQLQELFRARGYDNVTVHHCGYPDMMSDFALAQYPANVTEKGANICIYGFGTNDINKEDADLEEYLENTALVFDQFAKQGVAGLSLLMPWFDLEYAGKEGQDRLPGWNSMLAQLCMVKNVMVLDTYTPFQADPARFFNEKLTPRRHYSKDACRMIAEMAFAAIAPMIVE